jgi:hypothetical protein
VQFGCSVCSIANIAETGFVQTHSFRRAEIAKKKLSFVIDEKVIRFDISVTKPSHMGVVNCSGHLIDHDLESKCVQFRFGSDNFFQTILIQFHQNVDFFSVIFLVSEDIFDFHDEVVLEGLAYEFFSAGGSFLDHQFL